MLEKQAKHNRLNVEVNTSAAGKTSLRANHFDGLRQSRLAIHEKIGMLTTLNVMNETRQRMFFAQFWLSRAILHPIMVVERVAERMWDVLKGSFSVLKSISLEQLSDTTTDAGCGLTAYT